MSYSRTKRCTLTKKVSVPYPKSESSGSTTIIVEFPLEIDVHIDTDMFDSNVDKCSKHINLLTGAVVATEVAEIKAKKENAFKIGESLISGFFGYVRSEISQQVSELKTNIDSIILHLSQLKNSCLDKQSQMSSDFSRITSRYTKIFNDLDKEVHTRIAALDAPVFNFSSLGKTIHNRMLNNTLLGTIAVSANENSYLQSILYASSVKRRAQGVIEGANKFILGNYRQKRSFESVKFESNESTVKYIPVMFSEYVNKNTGNSADVYGLDSQIFHLSKLDKDNIKDSFIQKKLSWERISRDNQKRITTYFNNEVEYHFAQSSPHSDRVKQMILSMWRNNKLNVLSNN